MYGDIHMEHVIVSEDKMQGFWNVKTGGAYIYRRAVGG
jgi:hypothetical protein